jgi:hypothetical protein
MGWLSNLVSQVTSSPTGEWEDLFGQTGVGAGIPLGTARWMAPDAAIDKFAYRDTRSEGRVWVGEGFDQGMRSYSQKLVTG